VTLRVARAIAFDAARVYRGDRDVIESAGRKPGESEADRLIGFRAVVEVATWTKAVPGQVAVGPKYMRYDARSVSGLPSPFVVGAVQDRSRTAAPLEGATRRIPPSGDPPPAAAGGDDTQGGNRTGSRGNAMGKCHLKTSGGG